MRRIALGGALLAFLALQAGCGAHHHTRQAAAAAYPPAQKPTLIHGGLDSDVQVASGPTADAPEAAARGTVPDSVMLQGTINDSYRDSTSPNF